MRLADPSGALLPVPRGLDARISILYFATFLHLGVMSPFLPLWLSRQGVSPSWIAALLALPLVLRPVAAPFVAWVGRRGHVRAAIASSAFAASILIALGRFVVDPTALILVFVAFALVWEPLPILVDTFAVMAVRAHGVVFGRMRSWGSAAFLVTNVAGGALLDAVGVSAVPILISGLLVLPLATSLWLPSDRRWAEQRKPKRAQRRAPFADRQLLMSVAAVAIIVASQGVLAAFSSIGWAHVGVGSGAIGQLWAVGLASEIAFLWFGERLLAARDPVILVILGGIVSAFRWALMATSPGLVLSFGLQAMQGVSSMAPVLGLMLILARCVPIARVGLAQGLATSAIGLVQALVMVLGGALWPCGAPVAYGTMAAIASIGVVVAWTSSRMDKVPLPLTRTTRSP